MMRDGRGSQPTIGQRCVADWGHHYSRYHIQLIQMWNLLCTFQLKTTETTHCTWVSNLFSMNSKCLLSLIHIHKFSTKNLKRMTFLTFVRCFVKKTHPNLTNNQSITLTSSQELMPGAQPSANPAKREEFEQRCRSSIADIADGETIVASESCEIWPVMGKKFKWNYGIVSL